MYFEKLYKLYSKSDFILYAYFFSFPKVVDKKKKKKYLKLPPLTNFWEKLWQIFMPALPFCICFKDHCS